MDIFFKRQLTPVPEEGARAAKRLARTLGRSVAVSAVTGENMDGLLDELSEGRLLALLQSSATVLEEKYEGPNAEILARVPLSLVPRYEPYRVSS